MGDIDGYFSYHYNKPLEIPVLNSFKQNQNVELYYILTGTNTGYGFYGIHTATNKFIKITYLDSLDRAIKHDRFFNLSTPNGIARLEGYASYLTNYIAETEKLVKAEEGIDGNRIKLISFREDYIEKIFKWFGKEEAESIKGCWSYRVELLTVLPEEVNFGFESKKPQLYVIKKGLYPAAED